MGLEYTINGTVRVKDCPEVQTIITKIYERLSHEAMEVDDSAGDGTLDLNISYSDHQTIHCPEEMDKLLAGLTRYVVTPGHFEIEVYGESYDRFVGSQEQCDKSRHGVMVERMKEANKQITLDDDYLRKCGDGIAAVFSLKPDKSTHHTPTPRWETARGNRTSLGLAHTILNMADEIRSKTFDPKV